MLVRDGPQGIEVLMLRRNLASTWVGGVHLFPGGAVDGADAAPSLADRADRNEIEASALLGVGSGGLAHFVAAIRECFEEAGVLLAHPRAGEEFSRGWVGRLAAQRSRLNAGDITFAELCEEEDLLLESRALRYFSHWITPEGSTRRYDTRFFVAPAPPGQDAAHDEIEAIESRWVRPLVALEESKAGMIELWLPTEKNLEAISRFGDCGDLLAAAEGSAVATILPKIAEAPQGVRILLPGDEGYETVDDLRKEGEQ